MINIPVMAKVASWLLWVIAVMETPNMDRMTTLYTDVPVENQQ